jgi:hypothetical protein
MSCLTIYAPAGIFSRNQKGTETLRSGAVLIFLLSHAATAWHADFGPADDNGVGDRA